MRATPQGSTLLTGLMGGLLAGLLPRRAHGWINLRESGKELTFQTNVQVGDWQYDTTGPAKDLFVTGDMHIGKNASSVYIVGDAFTSDALFANAATVQSFLVTQEVRSTGLLSFKSGPGENIEFHPGKRTHVADLGSSLDVRSDLFVQDHTLVSDYLNATSALILGDLLYDADTATFNQSSVTFALAEHAAIVLNQDTSAARLVVQSTDMDHASAATMLLRNSGGVRYDVSATPGGNFEVALQDASSLRLLYGRFDPLDARLQFRLSGGLKVTNDGTTVWGGVEVQDLGTRVRGGTRIVGGARITDIGLTVDDGAVSVVGGLSITDGLVATDHSLLVRAGGVGIMNSGLSVVSGGARISSGGLTVTAGGFKLTGGMTARDQGMTLNSGGATVQHGGMIVTDVGVTVSEGTLHVRADGSSVTGGLTLVQPGLTVDGMDGARIEAGGAVVTGGVNILDAGFSLDGSACETGCSNGGNPAATGLCADGSHPMVCGVQVLADGLTVSGGVTVVDKGMTLDGKALKCVASAAILEGRVGVNDPGGPSMLDVGASWAAGMGVSASEANRGDAELQARGGAAPADFTIRISGSNEPGVTRYQWKKNDEAFGAALELTTQGLNTWLSLSDDVEIMFVAELMGDIQFREDDTWGVVVAPVNPLRVQDAAGDRSFHMMPNGTFHTDANVSVETGLTVSDGLSVLSRACAAFDVRGGCAAYDVGLDVRQDGAEIRGGVTITDTGLAATGATRVSAGGSTISGGLLVPDLGLDITHGGLSSGTGTREGRLTVVADGMHVVHDGLTVRDTGLQLSGGADLAGLVQLDGGTTVVDAGLTVSLGDLALGGAWGSRFGINTSTPQMMLDVHSRSAVTEVQFLPAHDSEDDLVVHGLYTGPSASTFDLEIDSAGSTDTFKWRKCTYATGSTQCDELYHDGVAVSSTAVYLTEGISVAFSRAAGHQRRDRWRIDVSPTNAFASLSARATASSFSVGQDGSVQVASGATVSNGAVVSGSGVRVGDDVVTRTGFQVDGPVAVHSGGAIVQDGLVVTGGVVQLTSNMEVSEGVRVSSPGNTHTFGQMTVAHGEVTLDSALIVADCLRAVDVGMTVSGGMLIGAGDARANRGIVVSSGGIQVAASGLTLEAAAEQSLQVQSGGASLVGGLAVLDFGLGISLGGLSLDGGLSVANGGIQTGSGMAVAAGGLAVRGGVSSSGAVTVSIDGLSVAHMGGVGFRVQAGGSRVDAGSLRVASDGANLQGGATVEGGLQLEGGSLRVLADGIHTGGLISIRDGGLGVMGGMQIDAGQLDVGRSDAAGLPPSSGLRVLHAGVGLPSAVVVEGGLRSSVDGLTIVGGGAACDVGLALDYGDWTISSGALGMNRGGASASYSLDVQSLTLVDPLLGLRDAESATSLSVTSGNSLSSAHFRGGTTFGGELRARSDGIVASGVIEVTTGTVLSVGGHGTSIDGGMVARAGAFVSGGQTVVGGVVGVRAGGVSANDGVRVGSGGASVNDQVRVINAGVSIETGGLHVAAHADVHGGMLVEGIELRSGAILHQGATVTGGIQASGAVSGTGISGNVVTQNGKRMGVNNAVPQYMLDIASRSTIRQPHHPGLQAAGTYTGYTESQLLVEIDATDSVDTFTWTKDGELMASNVAIAAGPQLLMEGISIHFLSVTGHALGDQWLLEVKPVNAIGSADLSGAPGFTVGQNGEVHVEGGARVENGLRVSNGELALHGSAGIHSNGQIAVHSSLGVHGLLAANVGLNVAWGAAMTNGELGVGARGMAVSGGATAHAGATITHGDATVWGDIRVGTSSSVQGTLTAGAVTVQCSGFLIESGGLAASGGVSVMGGGLEVPTGGVSVAADGLRSAGGARVLSGGVTVQSGGLSVHTGGASTAGGVRVGGASGGTGVLVRSGGLAVQQDGSEVTGGVAVISGGVTASDGLRVDAGGTAVYGGLSTDVSVGVTSGGVRVSDGAISINDAGSDRLMSIRSRSQVQTVPDSHNALTDAVLFGGTYTGANKAFFEVAIEDEDGFPTGTRFHWRKCFADGFSSSLSMSKPQCSPFSNGQAVAVGISQLQEGVWVRFAVAASHTHGDLWVAHVVAVDSVGLRSFSGDVRYALGQDGSSYAGFGVAVSNGMDVVDGLQVYTGGVRVAGGLYSTSVHVTGGATASAGGLAVHHGGSRVQDVASVSGGVSVSGSGIVGVGGASVIGSATVAGGAVLVNGGINANNGVSLSGGLIVNHPGLTVVPPESIAAPLRVLDGRILMNGALSTHMLTIRSKLVSRPLRVHSHDGLVGASVRADGGFTGHSGAEVTAGFSVAGTAQVVNGVQVQAGGAHIVVGTVQVDSGASVDADGAHIAGASTVADGLAVVGHVRVAGGDVALTGLTAVMGGLQVGPGTGDALQQSHGFGMRGGAGIAGSVGVAGRTTVRTGGVLIVSGSVGLRGGLSVVAGLSTRNVNESPATPGLHVQSGGAAIEGGLGSHGLRVLSGGLHAAGGAIVAASGASLEGGLHVVDTGFVISHGGRIAGGNMAVNSDQASHIASSQGSSSIITGTGGESWAGIFLPSGSYTGSVECGQVQIGIDGVNVNGVDTFSWAVCERPCLSSVFECAPPHEFVTITGAQPIFLADGIAVTFLSATAHELGAAFTFEFGLTNALKLSDSDGAESFRSAQNGALQLVSRAHIRNLRVSDGLNLATGSISVHSGGVTLADGLHAATHVSVAGGVGVVIGSTHIAADLQVLTGGLDVASCQMQVTGAAQLKQGLQVLDGVTVAGGADVAGGLTLDRLVAPSGVETLTGGISVEGSGLVHGGLVVPLGRLNVISGGFAVLGGFSTAEGLAVIDVGVHIVADGIQVDSGGLVTDEGIGVRTGGISSAGAITVHGSTGVYGGVSASSSFRIVAGGLNIAANGLAASGGVSVMGGGLEVPTGGVSVAADGLRSAGGARVLSGGVTVQSGGLSVHTGGASTAGGVRVGGASGGTGVLVRSGGLAVQQDGSEVTGGVAVISGGVTASDGLRVDAGGTAVYGGLSTDVSVGVTSGGVRVSDGAISINDAGSDRLMSIRSRSSIELALVQFEADADAVQFHGTYTGSPSAYLDVVVDHVSSVQGSVDTFKWRKCEVIVVGLESRYECTTFVSGIAISPGHPQLLTEGVFVTFASGSGHGTAHGWVAELTANDPVAVSNNAGDGTLTILQDGSLDTTRAVEIHSGVRTFDGLTAVGGASVSGGIVSEDALVVEAQGLRVASGRVDVAHGGLRALAGGVVVQDAGYVASGGAMMLGGLSVGGGLSVAHSDFGVSGLVSVHRGECGSEACVPSSFAGGIHVADNGVAVRGGATLSSLIANDGIVVATGGLGVHGSVSIAPTLVANEGHAFLLDAQGLDGGNSAPALFARDPFGGGRTVLSGSGAVVSSGGVAFASGATVATGVMQVVSDGVHVAHGGATISGGATVDAGVMWVREGGSDVVGGASLRGGVTVSEGLTIVSGGVDVHDGGCAIVGGLAISCGGATVTSGHIDAHGGLQLFAGRADIGAGLSLHGQGMRVDGGVSVFAGGGVLHGLLSVEDGGVNVAGQSNFRAGLGIVGGASVANAGIRVAGGMALSNGRAGLGSYDPFSLMAVRGQSSIGAVISQSDPNDVAFAGSYTGHSYPARIEVRIDSLAGAGRPVDTFAWTKCGTVEGVCVHTEASQSNVPIVLDLSGLPVAQSLIDGVSVTFLTATGHQVDESWSASLTAVNTLSLRNVLSAEHVVVGQNGAVAVEGGVVVQAGMSAADGVRVKGGRVSVLQGSAIYGQLSTNGKYLQHFAFQPWAFLPAWH